MMTPSAAQVIQTLNKILKKPTLATKLVSKVEVVNGNHPVQTLAIDGNATIWIHGKFWNDNVKTDADCEFVLEHEILHNVLGDTQRIRSSKDSVKENIEMTAENISMDARINAFITNRRRIQREQPSNISERMYRQNGIEGLLRPGSRYGLSSRFSELYKFLYDNRRSDKFKSFDEVHYAVRSLMRIENIKNATKIILIGNHAPGDGKESGIEPIQQNVVQEMAEQVLQGLGYRGGMLPGTGNDLMQIILEKIIEKRKLRLETLRSFAVTDKMNKLKSIVEVPRKKKTPVPIRPTRRESQLLAMGHTPMLFRNDVTDRNQGEMGVAIYLDVSGSVMDFLPKIVKMIVNVKEDITVISCFSTEVWDEKIDDLKKGSVRTTGGTDFTCIGEDIIKKKLRRVVVITDGFANMQKETGEKVLKQLEKGAVVLFGEKNYTGAYSRNQNNWFTLNKEKFKTFQLEDIVR